jgi:hypothetical protein
MALTDVAAVKAMLRWGQGATVKYEEQIPAFIAAAEGIIEGELGQPVIRKSLTYTVSAPAAVYLPHIPVSIESVTIDGDPYTGYTADLSAGALYGWFGTGAVVVTYTAGLIDPDADVPADIKFAATSLVVHLWSVASQRSGGLPEDYTAYPTGFLVPNVVKEALSHYYTVPGFA